MTGRRITDLYDVAPDQAVELARCLGGEVERLTLEAHAAATTAARIVRLRARVSAAYADAWAAGERRIAYRRHEALLELLEAGAAYWSEQHGIALDALQEVA